MKYLTKDGDVLDAICRKNYGSGADRVEMVLAANPGLAARGAVLPAGVLIVLPVVEEQPVKRPTIRLWGTA